MRFNFNLQIGKSKKFKINTINFPNMTNKIDVDSLTESFRHAYFYAFNCEGKVRVIQNEDVELDMKISLAQAYHLGSEKGIGEIISNLEQAVRIISKEVFEYYNLDLEIQEVAI